MARAAFVDKTVTKLKNILTNAIPKEISKYILFFTPVLNLNIPLFSDGVICLCVSYLLVSLFTLVSLLFGCVWLPGKCKDLNLDFLLFNNRREGDLLELHLGKELLQEGLVLDSGKIGFDLDIFAKKMPTHFFC